MLISSFRSFPLHSHLTLDFFSCSLLSPLSSDLHFCLRIGTAVFRLRALTAEATSKVRTVRAVSCVLCCTYAALNLTTVQNTVLQDCKIENNRGSLKLRQCRGIVYYSNIPYSFFFFLSCFFLSFSFFSFVFLFIHFSKAKSDAVVRLKLIEEQEGKLRDGRTVNARTNTAAVDTAVRNQSTAAVGNVTDSNSNPGVVAMDVETAIAATVTASEENVNKREESKGDETVASDKPLVAPTAENGTEASESNSNHGNTADAVNGNNISDNNGNSSVSNGNGGEVKNEVQQNEKQGIVEEPMSEDEAKDWRKYFLSACRWFDLDQVS